MLRRPRGGAVGAEIDTAPEVVRGQAIERPPNVPNDVYGIATRAHGDGTGVPFVIDCRTTFLSGNITVGTAGEKVSPRQQDVPR